MSLDDCKDLPPVLCCLHRRQVTETDRDFLAQSRGGFGYRRQGNGLIGWVQESIQLGAAGAHTTRHFALRNTAFNHGLLNHAGDYFFDGAGFDFFVDTFFSQEVFKARSNMVIFHFKPFSRFNRSLAKSRSGFGVFWLFLIKPCKSTIELPFTTNKTRAIRFASFVRTSHMSASTWSTRGSPSGQPNCTARMSLPISVFSIWGKDFSHSRTGSDPPAPWRKKTAISFGPSLSTFVWFILSKCTIFGAFSGMRAAPRKKG